MRNAKIIIVLLAFMLTFFVAGTAFLNKITGRTGTQISLSDTRNELKLEAKFPREKSERVQNYVRGRLQLKNAVDLQHFEAKRYITPDGSMDIHLKSRDGYLHIAMRKDRNGPDAIEKIKLTAEGLNKVLTNH